MADSSNGADLVGPEQRARTLRSQLYGIASQAASTNSLAELFRILAERSPELLGCGWVLVANQSRVGEPWRLTAGAGLAGVFEKPAGFEALDRLASRPPDGKPIDAQTQHLLGEVDPAFLAAGFEAARLSPPDDESTSVFVACWSTSDPQLPDRLAFAELVDDVRNAVDRILESQRHAQTARTLQRSLLPPRLPEIDGLEIGCLFNNAADHSRVGGDWYDVVRVDDTRTAFVVGDVAGHDIRSAALMGQVRHVVGAHLHRGDSPAEALAATDLYFADIAENVLATAVVMTIDTTKLVVEIALAGHPPPVLVSDDRARLVEVKPGAPIGLGYASQTNTNIELAAGDILIGYTDGVVERSAGDIDQHLGDFVTAVQSGPRTVNGLVEFIDRRSQIGELVDDVAALVVRCES